MDAVIASKNFQNGHDLQSNGQTVRWSEELLKRGVVEVGSVGGRVAGLSMHLEAMKERRSWALSPIYPDFRWKRAVPLGLVDPDGRVVREHARASLKNFRQERELLLYLRHG